MCKRLISTFFSVVLITGCGGTDTPTVTNPPPVRPSEPPVPSAPNIEAKDAARFLNQATFGVTDVSIEQVTSRGFEEWINWQMSLPATSQVAYLQAREPTLAADDEIRRIHRLEAWWKNSLEGEDQLRQRVAFALSQIFVISEKGGLFQRYFGLSNYYDMLANNAFGNYRQLLEKVTLSPMMGKYLSMLGNEKPDARRNIRPDENYAREVLQLFSVGLVELNVDGSEKQDANGMAIPSYNQDVIRGFSHVFTGWHFHGVGLTNWWGRPQDWINPMSALESRHDIGTKMLLNGVTLAANQTAQTDLTQALDNIFQHLNVGPFISKQLIQRLVTSNPSPTYVARVSGIFDDNGQGVRGDLAAVVKAILLDDEARNGHKTLPTTFGKLREPILKATHVLRAFKAEPVNGYYVMGNPEYYFNQGPLMSPSVFNFFSPSYAPLGEVANQSLVAPEFQIVTENFAIRTSNFLASAALWSREDSGSNRRVTINFAEEIALAGDIETLLNRLDLLLMAGAMPADMREVLKEAYASLGGSSASSVGDLVFLITNSPQYAVQK